MKYKIVLKADIWSEFAMFCCFAVLLFCCFADRKKEIKGKVSLVADSLGFAFQIYFGIETNTIFNLEKYILQS